MKLRPIPLWDKKFNQAALKRKEEEEPRAFQRGFRMIALSDEEKTFPNFPDCRCHGVSLGEVQRNRSWKKFTGVDLASEKRPGNAIFTIALEPETHRRFPVDIRHGAWRSHETAAQLSEVVSSYNPEFIMVENNAYQGSLIDWIKFLKLPFWFKVEPTTTGSEKRDAKIGLPGLQIEFKHKAWVIDYDRYEQHSPACPCSWCLFDREMANHPLGATTDVCMAAWFAKQGIDRFGYSVAMPANLGNLGAR